MLYRNAPMVDRAVRITTSTTAITVASEITRLNATYSSRSKNVASPVIWAIVAFTEVNTASPSRVYQTTAEATTIMMPIATDSRNDSFITDHGSIRATASRTLRAAPGVVVAVAPEAVPAEVAPTDLAPTEEVPGVGASRTAVGTPSSAVVVGPPVRVVSATFCAVRLIRSPIDGALSPLSGAVTGRVPAPVRPSVPTVVVPGRVPVRAAGAFLGAIEGGWVRSVLISLPRSVRVPRQRGHPNRPR